MRFKPSFLCALAVFALCTAKAPAATFGCNEYSPAQVDVTPVFETSGDDQFQSSASLFHFDTANNTLYFSPDGTTGSAVALTQVESGVTLGPADIRIVS